MIIRQVGYRYRTVDICITNRLKGSRRISRSVLSIDFFPDKEEILENILPETLAKIRVPLEHILRLFEDTKGVWNSSDATRHKYTDIVDDDQYILRIYMMGQVAFLK